MARLLLLLLLLLVCSSQATHFFGTVMTYFPKETGADGSITVVLRYKLATNSCSALDYSCLRGDCGTRQSLVRNTVDRETGGLWCQEERIQTRLIPTNDPFEFWLNGGGWITPIVNNIGWYRALTVVELRRRSDTGRANRSPQTTVVPVVRVPRNCPRDFNLLTFDADGDAVRCRYGSNPATECNPCTQPSALNLSSSCILSFIPNSPAGDYAVQVVMEDFPKQSITLTNTSGLQESRSILQPISQIPVQFVVRVDPVVESCMEGLYLPKFVSPTPINGQQFSINANQELRFSIAAEANMSTITELLVSGPHNVNQRTLNSPYNLSWTPSAGEAGESHPICFVVQATSGSARFHSELRCVIVNVTTNPTTTTTTTSQPPFTADITTDVTAGVTADVTGLVTTDQEMTTELTTPPGPTPPPNLIVVGLRMRISSSLSEDLLRDTLTQQIKDELVRRGIPSNIDFRLLNITRVPTAVTATSSPIYF